jgi:hypothetical protein
MMASLSDQRKHRLSFRHVRTVNISAYFGNFHEKKRKNIRRQNKINNFL